MGRGRSVHGLLQGQVGCPWKVRDPPRPRARTGALMAAPCLQFPGFPCVLALVDSPARGGSGGCKLIRGCVCFGGVTPNPACGSFSTPLLPALQACYFGNLSLTGYTWVCSLAVLLAQVVLNDQSAPRWMSLSTSWGPRSCNRGEGEQEAYFS